MAQSYRVVFVLFVPRFDQETVQTATEQCRDVHARLNVEPISLSSSANIDDLFPSVRSRSSSAACLAFARPQVRFTGAGTACDAGAQPRGSR